MQEDVSRRACLNCEELAVSGLALPAQYPPWSSFSPCIRWTVKLNDLFGSDKSEMRSWSCLLPPLVWWQRYSAAPLHLSLAHYLVSSQGCCLAFIFFSKLVSVWTCVPFWGWEELCKVSGSGGSTFLKPGCTKSLSSQVLFPKRKRKPGFLSW